MRSGLPAVLITAPLALAAQGAASPRAERETYVYEARPTGDSDDQAKERMTIAVEHPPQQARLTMTTESERGREDIAVIVQAPDSFLEATREVSRDGSPVRRDLVRRDGPAVALESRHGSSLERKTLRLAGQPLAVDASLLLFLRSFVEGSAHELKVFMVDFSQRSTTVTLRKRGTETVVVPAGSYTCHKLEVAVKFLVFEAVITYWVAVDPPHFLVKHVGKRGPFSKTMLTTLLSRSGR